MTQAELHDALQQAVHEVLETMFFVRELDDGVIPDGASTPDLAAQLDFEGNPGGQLTLILAGHAARTVAADFLGADEDELSEQQVEEVACELANMICGSVLSRTESETRFCLSSPHIIAVDQFVFPQDESVHNVGLDRGALAVHLTLWPNNGGNRLGPPSDSPQVCVSEAG